MHLLLLRLFVSRIVVELFGSADVDLASSDTPILARRDACFQSSRASCCKKLTRSAKKLASKE